MQINYENDKLVIKGIPRDELDAAKTFECGQSFRWRMLNNGTWYNVLNSKVVLVKQDNDTIYTNLDKSDEDWFVNYMDLNTNYKEEFNKLGISKDDYAYKAYEVGKGIHVLRQELYETIITFVLSQMNSMHNIRNCVEKLSKKFGMLVVFSNIQGYTFPDAKILGEASIEDLSSCSLGFRAEYVKNISKYIANNPDFLEILRMASYETSMHLLKNFKGIGDKVANCICLFSLHHINAFPIDTHIKQIIDKYYNGSLDLNKFGDIAGIVQQYMFYYKAFCK